MQYVYLYNSPWLGGKWRRSFLIGQYHFKNSLAVAFDFFLLCELCVFACWAYFYCRIAGWNKSFGRVTWESKYDVGRPETCKDPKNITDEAILCTFLSVWLQLLTFEIIAIKSQKIKIWWFKKYLPVILVTPPKTAAIPTMAYKPGVIVHVSWVEHIFEKNHESRFALLKKKKENAFIFYW